MENAPTRLAPRELADLVYRCCRVAGIDPGTANRCARNVVHSQIHRGTGVNDFQAALSQGTTAVLRFASAADLIEIAEATATSATFAVPVPVSSISESLWQATLRGRGPVDLGDTEPISEVSHVEFVPVPISSASVDANRNRETAAMTEGVPLARHVLTSLESASARFLVGEAVVDAALEAN